MRLWLRILLLGTIALLLTGFVPRPAHGQYWQRSNSYNPYYAFFWQNYWSNYGTPNYFPGAWYWGAYSSYPGMDWWYSYNYPPGYVSYVPYYVAVPEPYLVDSASRAPATKSSAKADMKKPAQRKQQEERDAVRQLKLAKVLLEAADEEQRTGNEENAQRLRQLAHGHLVEIGQRYPSTPASKEAQQLLAKEEAP